MKKTFILTILLFVLTICKSQNLNYQLDSLIINTPLKDSVAKYYKNVYKAQDYIMRENYKKAAEKYAKAFTYIEYPFLTDINSALKCELYGLKNKERIKEYIFLKINKGIKKSVFLNDNLLRTLPFWDEIKTVIDTSQSRLDTILISKLDYILELDQGIRIETREQGFPQDSIANCRIEAIDSICIDSIKSILIETTYISEELVGTKTSILGLVALHNSYFLEYYILLHKSVICGKFDARKYYNNLKRSSYRLDNKNYLSFSCYGYTVNLNVYTHRKTRSFERRLLNKYRKKLYLEDIYPYHQKRAWQALYNNVFTFYPRTQTFFNKELYNKLLTKKVDNNDFPMIIIQKKDFK